MYPDIDSLETSCITFTILTHKANAKLMKVRKKCDKIYGILVCLVLFFALIPCHRLYFLNIIYASQNTSEF